MANLSIAKGISPALITLITLAALSTILHAAAQPTPPSRCANDQPFNSTNGTCVCNQDPAEGATFRGASCQLASTECGGSVFCLNSGACEKLFNTESYQCSCPAGTRGANCQLLVDDCGTGLFCTNGGTCQNLNNVQSGAICICPTGFVGQRCEVDAAALDADVCGPQVYCLNGGTCNAAKTACTCAAGFAGTNCGARVSETASPGSTEIAAATGGGGGGGSKLSGGAIAGIVIAAVLVALLLASLLLLVWRERRGKPVFVPFNEDDPSRRIITNAQLSDKNLGTQLGERGSGREAASPV